MAENSKKRSATSITSFFAQVSSTKRARHNANPREEDAPHASSEAEPEASLSTSSTNHSSYPHAIKDLPPSISSILDFAPEAEARAINNKPDLDLLYYQPYIPSEIKQSLYAFLRAELPFYRVKYTIKRGSVETLINTPRFTTVFGVDETSKWTTDSPPELIDASTRKPVSVNAYKARPRPIPACLDTLRRSTEAVTGHTFNFCLVNYYSSGDDSISYHSDDERFLGDDPCIASFSLGNRRDFLLRHKDKTITDSNVRDLKFELGPGDMLLMKGKTQKMWLHSIPKRKGPGDKSRINITFRKAVMKPGTDNYYNYNVGDGEVYRWDDSKREMALWKKPGVEA